MNKTQQQIMSAVLSRASSDWEFRQTLLADPRRALRDTFGLVIPDPFKIRFVERDADLDALVVLPDFKTDGHGDELAEDELEAVNGGVGAAWSSYR